MHLFTRTVHMAGPMPEVLAYATDIRQYVSDKSGLDLALWSVGFGAPLGTMTFATRIDGLAGVMEVNAMFADDAEYHAKVAAGLQYRGAMPPVDSLSQLVHGQFTEESPPVGSVAMVTTAQIANGKYDAGFAWSIDIAQHIEGIQGSPVMFLMAMAGAFGQVTWVTVYPDAAALDAANDKVNVDPGYHERLGAGGDLFVPGSGQRSIGTRIA